MALQLLNIRVDYFSINGSMPRKSWPAPICLPTNPPLLPLILRPNSVPPLGHLWLTLLYIAVWLVLSNTLLSPDPILPMPCSRFVSSCTTPGSLTFMPTNASYGKFRALYIWVFISTRLPHPDLSHILMLIGAGVLTLPLDFGLLHISWRQPHLLVI